MSRLIKSAKALSYAEQFKQQCPVLEELLLGDLCVTMHIWYASRRPDLDESLILDLLQDRVYKNDRQVKERHTYWHLDPLCPRTLIEVKKMAPAISQRGAKQGGNCTAVTAQSHCKIDTDPP